MNQDDICLKCIWNKQLRNRRKHEMKWRRLIHMKWLYLDVINVITINIDMIWNIAYEILAGGSLWSLKNHWFFIGFWTILPLARLLKNICFSTVFEAKTYRKPNEILLFVYMKLLIFYWFFNDFDMPVAEYGLRNPTPPGFEPMRQKALGLQGRGLNRLGCCAGS